MTCASYKNKIERGLKKTVSASEKKIVLQVLGAVVVLFALFALLQRFGALTVFEVFPTAKAGMVCGILFVIGLLASLHCVAM